MPHIPPQPSLLRERFPITLPDGRTWQGALYGTYRRGGRRIIVSGQAGAVLFDTGDQFDFDNARNELDLWLAEQVKAEAVA